MPRAVRTPCRSAPLGSGPPPRSPVGLLYGAIVLRLHGWDPALTYLPAYVLEKSLSIDNTFVFVALTLAIAASLLRRPRRLRLKTG